MESGVRHPSDDDGSVPHVSICDNSPRNTQSQQPSNMLPVCARVPTINLLKTHNTSLLATRIKRLQSELKEMTEDPPPNCSASPKGDKSDDWIATLTGPEGSVYENGVFFLDVKFPPEYPFKPVHVRFLTRIYHCNINSKGEICLDILKDKWSPALNLGKVLLAISSLLCDCNPNDPLVGAIARQYLTDRREHDRVARIWTKNYAS